MAGTKNGLWIKANLEEKCVKNLKHQEVSLKSIAFTIGFLHNKEIS